MKDFRKELERLYEETMRGNFSCVDELFHPDYRSVTEEGEDSAAAFIEGTQRIIDSYEVLESEVLFTLGSDDYVGILHRFVVETKDENRERSEVLRSDFYRIQDDMFIEHWGVPAG